MGNRTVSYSVGFTRNMGDFESLRVDFGLTDEPFENEKASEAMNRVRDYLNGMLLDEVAAVEKDIIAMRKEVRETGDYKRKVKNAAKKDDEEDQPLPEGK